MGENLNMMDIIIVVVCMLMVAATYHIVGQHQMHKAMTAAPVQMNDQSIAEAMLSKAQTAGGIAQSATVNAVRASQDVKAKLSEGMSNLNNFQKTMAMKTEAQLGMGMKPNTAISGDTDLDFADKRSEGSLFRRRRF